MYTPDHPGQREYLQNQSSGEFFLMIFLMSLYMVYFFAKFLLPIFAACAVVVLPFVLIEHYFF